jgi:alkylation response protein AidB-like acyl-CoA dehydrogenase
MFELSSDHRQIRDLARDFARNEVLPGAAERDRTHAFPAEIFAQLAEMGFMGMFVPEAYGGAGLDVLSYVVALEEICYADAGVGVIMSVQNSLAGWPILEFGTEAQKHTYLTPLATGQKVGCYALTEPNAGSDAGAQRTRATPTATGWRLDGTKMWITNGPQADICVTYASLDPDQRHRAVCAFIVDTSSPGFSVGKVEEKMGITCSSTSELIFEGLEVPTENLLHAERTASGWRWPPWTAAASASPRRPSGSRSGAWTCRSRKRSRGARSGGRSRTIRRSSSSSPT